MNEMIYYVGMNNLMMILEQERKHWLLSTNKKKTSQDKRTGDMFTGTVENNGFAVNTESRKIGQKLDIVNNIRLTDSKMNDVIKAGLSAFPYTNILDGVFIQRIISSQYMIDSSNRVHYKVKFNHCKEIIIPIAGAPGSESVFQSKWIMTENPPTMLLLDPVTGEADTDKPCNMTDLNDCVWFYPLDTNLQPFTLKKTSSTSYETSVVDSDAYIGYPLFWFSCREFKQMNRISFENMEDNYFAIGNSGASKINEVNVYGGFSDNLTPSGEDLSAYKITCTSDKLFVNTNADFNNNLTPVIQIKNTTTNTVYDYNIICSDGADFKITMDRNIGWEYVNNSLYQISMSKLRNDGIAPLKALFNINITPKNITSIRTNDTGVAGMSAKTTMYWNKDNINSYIEGLYTWDGLPENINERLNSGEGVVLYAIHDTPSAIKPTDKQTAAIILDPGNINAYPEDTDVNAYDLGRAYLLSNDELKYENNATTEHPKPGRTVARICDIPTSVVQLSNITGLAPTNVVDKQYVRTECSFDLEDKERLYNTLTDRWVRPTHLMSNGTSVYESIKKEDNMFIFHDIEDLKKIDLINHNNFRTWINLNPMVDPYSVSVSSIIERGSGYEVNNSGLIIVGGVSFTYIVQEVNESGGVTKVVVGPSKEGNINLSNFDMSEGYSGISAVYGSSPLDGEGTGLKIKFMIDNYKDILTTRGEIYPDLFALVTNTDGLWLYSYIINQEYKESPKLGFWEVVAKISDYENSNVKIKDGYLSLTDSYINALIPTVHELPVSLTENGKEQIFIEAMVTGGCVNIINKQYTPIKKENSSSVDLNKFITDGVRTSTASHKTFESILHVLNISELLTFDSYLLWRWISTTDPSNLKFEYMICRRSFNNYVSSDQISLLPENKLRYNKYVHTNAGTTVTWNVDTVGQLVWVYNPSSIILEKYTVNDYGKLNINYIPSTWDIIDVRDTSTGKTVDIVDNSGRLLWNIATNNPYQTKYEPDDNEEIYQQPEYIEIEDLRIGNDIKTINPMHNPIGSWTLVFPRSHNYNLRSTSYEGEINLLELGVVRTNNLTDTAIISDKQGININDAMMVIDQSASGVKLKIFDKKTSMWKSL